VIYFAMPLKSGSSSADDTLDVAAPSKACGSLKFEPSKIDDVDGWMEAFEATLALASVPQAQYRHAFLLCSSQDVLLSIAVTTKAMEWGVAKQHVLSVYGSTMSAATASRELHKLRQTRRQDVRAFAQEFITMARRSKLAEKAYTPLFVLALVPAISRCMLEEYSAMEAAVKKACEVEDRLTALGTLREAEPVVAAAPQQVRSSGPPKKGSCHYCGKEGHWASQCFAKKRADKSSAGVKTEAKKKPRKHLGHLCSCHFRQLVDGAR
jgi:hypothetical protein